MPAINEIVAIAVAAPGWVWVGVAVLLAALALADDRAGKVRAGLGAARSIPHDLQIFASFGLVGFLVGWVWSPAELAAMAGGLL